ncbi:MAG: hypothetical protein H7645_08200 [Candidatus Heimdallarchaeota archaeon]|nr:hypothetical protein [Candidatus Heimdallarchaeota archaeon]MCK4770305.1 hypothetical protein [Candidatus Heimdallarchaeota archaeon]
MINRQRVVLIGSIIVVIFVGTTIGVYLGVFHNKQDTDILFTIQSSTMEKNYTMADLMELESVAGYGGYKKATGTIVGPFLYKGVSLDLLLDEVGGISSSEDLEVEASDGWKVTYTSQMLSGNVIAYDNLTGENLGLNEFQIILAYEEDGSKIPSDDGPVRFAFISEEGYLTDGNLWAKKVETMKIKSATNMWSVYLYGISNDSIDRSSFEAALFSGEENHSVFFVLQEDLRNNTYQGIPLWTIISLIDGELEGSTHYTFNDTLASLGYDIILKNSEEQIILNSIDIARNNSYILAAKKNSIFLTDNEAPLRIVGPALTGTQMISGIIEIWLDL